MFKRLLRPIHPSWNFYTLTFGIVFGIILSIVTEQTLITSFLWIPLLIILILLCFRHACLLTAGIVFLTGFLLGSFRTSFELSGHAFTQNLTSQNIIVAGNLAEDPDDNSGKLVLRLHHLRFYTASDPVENLWKSPHQPVENSVQNSAARDSPPATSGSLQDLTNTDSFTPASGTLYVTLSTEVELTRSDLVILQGKLDAGFGTFVGKMSRPEILAVERSDPGDIFAQFKHCFPILSNNSSRLPRSTSVSATSWV